MTRHCEACKQEVEGFLVNPSIRMTKKGGENPISAARIVSEGTKITLGCPRDARCVVPRVIVALDRLKLGKR